MPGPTTICPFCGKTVRAKSNTFDHHSSSGRVTCPLSYQGVPRTGFTEADWEDRAKIVANLAWQLRECDPVLTWTYLTSLPADELQRLLMVALAGIPVDLRLSDIFRWVTQLPVAVSA